jgi:hypothetical protein
MSAGSTGDVRGVDQCKMAMPALRRFGNREAACHLAGARVVAMTHNLKRLRKQPAAARAPDKRDPLTMSSMNPRSLGVKIDKA